MPHLIRFQHCPFLDLGGCLLRRAQPHRLVLQGPRARHVPPAGRVHPARVHAVGSWYSRCLDGPMAGGKR